MHWINRTHKMRIGCCGIALSFMAVFVFAAEMESIQRNRVRSTQLYVSTNPAGADIKIDGQPRGTSNQLFQVPPGVKKMTIEVELDGHSPKEQEVEIRGGRITRIVLDLEKRRPPVSGELEAKGREILHEVWKVNWPWLVPARPHAEGYRYQFQLAGHDPQEFDVTRGQPTSLAIRQGITYQSALHALVTSPEDVSFRQVQVGDEKITLAFLLKAPIRMAVGNGVSGTWLGYTSASIGEGTLTIDAASYAPLELETNGIREVMSHYVDLAEDVVLGVNYRAPLKITIHKEDQRFEWNFRVYEGGLWLFHEARSEKQDSPIAWIDRVFIGGREAAVQYQIRRDQTAPVENPFLGYE